MTLFKDKTIPWCVTDAGCLMIDGRHVHNVFDPGLEAAFINFMRDGGYERI